MDKKSLSQMPQNSIHKCAMPDKKMEVKEEESDIFTCDGVVTLSTDSHLDNICSEVKAEPSSSEDIKIEENDPSLEESPKEPDNPIHNALDCNKDDIFKQKENMASFSYNSQIFDESDSKSESILRCLLATDLVCTPEEHAPEPRSSKDKLGPVPDYYKMDAIDQQDTIASFFCNSIFFSGNDSSKQLETGPKKDHLCEICDKKFSTKAVLNKHTRIHTGEKLHACHYCNKRFIQKSDLIDHINIHTGEKPHVCQHCNRSFVQKAHLRNHLKTHTGEKPHTCQYCNKSFGLKQHLIRHMKIHTGEKPFLCIYCAKSYTRKEHLIAHLASHPAILPQTS